MLRNSFDAGDDEPSSFLEVVTRLCGADAAARLCQELGGSRVKLPAEPRPYHRITLVLGLKGARRVVAEFGHGNVDVPLGQTAIHHQRRASAEAMTREGKSAAEIARALGCSVRSVSRYRARVRERAAQ
jgi:hypothetical protein